MKVKNNNGFTLVESIISFAILSIAGAMFVFAFFHFSSLLKEASNIKTSINEAYEQIQKESNDNLLSGDYSLKMTVDSKTVTFNHQKVYQVSKQSPYAISFVKSEPSLTADFFPQTIQGGNQTVTYKDASFYLLKSYQKIPMSENEYMDISKDDYTCIATLENAIDASTSAQYGHDLTDALHVVPTITNIQDYIFDDTYRSYIQGGYKIVWFAIENKTDTAVYGYVLPTKGQYFLYKNQLRPLSEIGILSDGDNYYINHQFQESFTGYALKQRQWDENQVIWIEEKP